MKKNIIGAIVGGLIIFIWQFLSFTVLNLHDDANTYTPNQDSVLQYLGEHLKEGQYFLPGAAPGASSEEMEKATPNGKPWVIIAYHTSYNASMGMAIGRSLATDIVMIFLLCWVLSKIPKARFGTIFIACICVGLIAFFNVPYTTHIFYQTFDIMAYFNDALISFGLCGLWLGWWLPVKRKY